MENEEKIFVIDSDEKALWAAEKIRGARAEIEKWESFYKEQFQKIKENNEEKIVFFTSLLAGYFETVPRRKTKTGIEKYKLPGCELQYMPPKIEYVKDNLELLHWCRENAGDMIKVTEEPKWAEIKKYISESGIIPDGVTPVEGKGKFEVKI